MCPKGRRGQPLRYPGKATTARACGFTRDFPNFPHSVGVAATTAGFAAKSGAGRPRGGEAPPQSQRHFRQTNNRRSPPAASLSGKSKCAPGRRQRGLERQRLAADGMRDRQSPRVQGDARGERPNAPVFPVADDGPPAMRQLHANLVLSPRLQLDFQQRRPGSVRQSPVAEARLLRRKAPAAAMRTRRCRSSWTSQSRHSPRAGSISPSTIAQ